MEHRVDSLADGVGALWSGPSQEVGEAGQDADVGLIAHLVEGLLEDLNTAAGQNLSSLDRWASADTRLVDVIADVRVTTEGEAAGLRHREAARTTGTRMDDRNKIGRPEQTMDTGRSRMELP